MCTHIDKNRLNGSACMCENMFFFVFADYVRRVEMIQMRCSKKKIIDFRTRCAGRNVWKENNVSAKVENSKVWNEMCHVGKGKHFHACETYVVNVDIMVLYDFGTGPGWLMIYDVCLGHEYHSIYIIIDAVILINCCSPSHELNTLVFSLSMAECYSNNHPCLTQYTIKCTNPSKCALITSVKFGIISH